MVPCLTEAPPARPGKVFKECDGWAACLDSADLIALGTYLFDATEWMNNAWSKCRTLDDPEE